MQSADITQLVTRILSGDLSAQHDLVIALQPAIERQLLRYPVSDEDRRDLTQTTLIQVLRRLSSFRGESSFSTWLFRVTANEALMLMRSQRRHRAKVIEGMDWETLTELPTAIDAASIPHDEAASNLQRDALVRRALADLPDDYRDVVVAHYHLDLGLQEIADRFELSESAVRSRLHRARSRLRDMLETGPHNAEFMPRTVNHSAAVMSYAA
jgi:RNA polymerase sigma-70 factor, ECF subfamily